MKYRVWAKGWYVNYANLLEKFNLLLAKSQSCLVVSLKIGFSIRFNARISI